VRRDALKIRRSRNFAVSGTESQLVACDAAVDSVQTPAT
jgi:hypothetical protein